MWNETGAALDLQLQPFFHQTRAFYAVYLLAAAGVFALGLWFHHARVRWLRNRERDLLRLVDERQQAEEALRRAHDVLQEHAAQLARSNAELKRFAYVASHDLKEPLRAVISFTQLLAKKYQGQLDEEAHEYIGFAVDAALSMRAQIENLLTYSRVGRADRGDADCHCERELATALRNLQAAVMESGAEVTHDPLPQVAAHPSEIVQLFQNLIGNAIKFRGAATPRVHVSAEIETQGVWRICVVDNGIGIAPEHRERVFGLFQRLHPREQYPGTGTGIGLSVCRKIVESRGGRIWVEPAQPQGSRFCFTLPAAGRAAAASAAGQSAVPA